jgi:hypothetical protein
MLTRAPVTCKEQAALTLQGEVVSPIPLVILGRASTRTSSQSSPPAG